MNLASHLPELPAPDAPGLHWNRAEDLPPVDLWLLVKIDGNTAYARRTSHIENRKREMEYQLASGQLITDRLEWTYP